MINKESLKEVNNSRIGEFTVPLYNTYCFSNIVGTIKDLFGIENTKGLPINTIKGHKETNKVIFFLVDGFGWKFYERTKKKSEFFKIIDEEGIESKLTTQFPSSTSGQIPTILTNESINEHGIVDWYYYEPRVDDNIVAFLFKNSFEKGNENLKLKGYKPEDFLIKESFFGELKKYDINSIAYQPKNLNGSTYSKYMFRDSSLIGYDNYNDLKEILLNDLKNKNKTYYYVYLPQIDTIGHEFGHDSKEFEKELNNFINFIDSFYKEIRLNEKLTILLSADHGQIEIEKEKTEYLNIKIKDINKYLKRNKMGNIYSPCGYYRDVFLHVKEECIDELKELLQKEFEGKAMIFTIEEAIKLRIFNNPTKHALERIGNMLIIPLENNSIWFYEEGIFDVNVKGVHGGLSKDEMEIPFLFLEKEP